MSRSTRRRAPAPPKFLPNTQLRKLREMAGLSQQALANLAGCGQSDIAKLESGQKKSTVDWMVRIAPHLHAEPKDLMPEVPGNLTVANTPSGPILFPRRRMPSPTDLMPVRSAARGGAQQMFLNDGPIDWRPRPHFLEHVEDAYCVYVFGDSMTPRFREGQLLYVNPGRPPSAGYGVILTKTDNSVAIKEFVRWTATAIELRQYNPDQKFEVPFDEIRDLHVVVALEEP